MSDWNDVTLSSLANLRKGITYKSEHYATDDCGHPFITIKCFVKGGGYAPQGLKYYEGPYAKADQLEVGDILFAVTDLTRAGDIVGSPLRVPDFGGSKPSLASMDCMRIDPIRNVCDGEFLYHRMMLSDIRRQMVAFSAGSTVLHLDINKVPSIILRVPVRTEVQQAIAKVLRVVDQAIEKTEALIEKYEQIKAGLMHDLFTRGIGPDGKLRPPRERAPELYQETPIGWIPKEWTPRQLKAMLDISGGYLQTGPFGSQLHAHEYTHEGVPVVMPQDISDGRIHDEQVARIPGKRARMLAKHCLRDSDIIIARRGELTRAAAIDSGQDGWLCGTGCFLLRLAGSALDSRFMAMAYRHPMVQRQVEGLAVGSTMPSLNNEIMGKLVFPDIDAAEQSVISENVGAAEYRLTGLRRDLEKLRKKKAGLMHDLLTGKVPVNPDPPEGADAEPQGSQGAQELYMSQPQPRRRDDGTPVEKVPVDPT